MKFEIQFSNSEKYPIDGFIDALREEAEVKQYNLTVSFLSFHRNSATLIATPQFGEYLKEKFKNNKSINIKFPDNYHNPFHVMTLGKDGYMECGCGYRESEQEHTRRVMIVLAKTGTLEEYKTAISGNQFVVQKK